MPKSGTDFYWGFVLIDPEALLEFSWRVLRSQLGPECLPWEPKGHLQLLLFLQVTCSGQCSWDSLFFCGLCLDTGSDTGCCPGFLWGLIFVLTASPTSLLLPGFSRPRQLWVAGHPELCVHNPKDTMRVHGGATRPRGRPVAGPCIPIRPAGGQSSRDQQWACPVLLVRR